jgi:hypothetical protein
MIVKFRLQRTPSTPLIGLVYVYPQLVVCNRPLLHKFLANSDKASYLDTWMSSTPIA